MEAAGGAGQLLTVEIPAAPEPWLAWSIQAAGEKGGEGLHPPGGMGEIKWALVQQAVRFALAHGWSPDAPRRGAVTFTYRDYRFRAKAAPPGRQKERSRRRR